MTKPECRINEPMTKPQGKEMGATAFSTRETAILHGKNKVFGHSETGKSTINAQIWAAIAARN
ncbi:MAG: hypothetical protein K2R98_28825 [Gemmataceae bacterium]|nr:hypothetical protein [Gemmataceae bacterium]